MRVVRIRQVPNKQNVVRSEALVDVRQLASHNLVLETMCMGEWVVSWLCSRGWYQLPEVRSGEEVLSHVHTHDSHGVFAKPNNNQSDLN